MRKSTIGCVRPCYSIAVFQNRVWVRLTSRYSGGQDNEFWLEAWNGNPYLVERLVEALTRSGWLRREAAKPSGPKGGKPARRWQVNPLLWAAETAETAETSALKLGSEISADSAVSAAT